MPSQKHVFTGFAALMLLSAPASQAQEARRYIVPPARMPLHHVPRGSALEFMSTEFFPTMPCPTERDRAGFDTGIRRSGTEVDLVFQGGRNLSVDRATGRVRSRPLPLDETQPYCRISVGCGLGPFTLGPSGTPPTMGRRISMRLVNGQAGQVVCTGERISTRLYLDDARVRSIECSSRQDPPVPLTVSDLRAIIGEEGAPASPRVPGQPPGVRLRIPDPAHPEGFAAVMRDGRRLFPAGSAYNPGVFGITDGCPPSVVVARTTAAPADSVPAESDDSSGASGADDSGSTPQWNPGK